MRSLAQMDRHSPVSSLEILSLERSRAVCVSGPARRPWLWSLDVTYPEPLRPLGPKDFKILAMAKSAKRLLGAFVGSDGGLEVCISRRGRDVKQVARRISDSQIVLPRCQ